MVDSSIRLLVVVRRGLIVSFRALITAGKQQVEDKTPIQTMTEEFLQRLRKKPSDHDGGTGGDALTAGMGVTPRGRSQRCHRRRGCLQALCRQGGVQGMALISVYGPSECKPMWRRWGRSTR